MDYNIFANHAHVFPGAVKEEGTVEKLLCVMEQCNIEKCVAFAPFNMFVEELGIESNSWLEKQIRHRDRIVGFGTVNFNKGEIEEQVKNIHELGFKGIKMHPAFQKISVTSKEAFQVYAKAEELGLFISFHTGVHWHRIKDYQLLLFDEVAQNFPKLRFSMEHVGGYCFFNEAVAVILNNTPEETGVSRIYAGLTSVFNMEYTRNWYLNDKQIKDLLWLIGDDYALFGLDFPYNSVETIQAAINHLKSMDISESSKRKILGGNLKKLLQL